MIYRKPSNAISAKKILWRDFLWVVCWGLVNYIIDVPLINDLSQPLFFQLSFYTLSLSQTVFLSLSLSHPPSLSLLTLFSISLFFDFSPSQILTLQGKMHTWVVNDDVKIDSKCISRSLHFSGFLTCFIVLPSQFQYLLIEHVYKIFLKILLNS